jgi:hypothetical protein
VTPRVREGVDTNGGGGVSADSPAYLANAMFEYIEIFYNRQSRHSNNLIANHGWVRGWLNSIFPPETSVKRSGHFSALLSAEENPIHEDNRRKCRSEGPKESIEANQHGRCEMEHGPGKKQRYQYARRRYEGDGKNDLDSYN